MNAVDDSSSDQSSTTNSSTTTNSTVVGSGSETTEYEIEPESDDVDTLEQEARLLDEELAARRQRMQKEALKERIRGLRDELQELSVPVVTASLSKDGRTREDAVPSTSRTGTRDEHLLVRTVYNEPPKHNSSRKQVSKESLYNHIVSQTDVKAKKLPVRRDVSQSYHSDGSIRLKQPHSLTSRRQSIRDAETHNASNGEGSKEHPYQINAVHSIPQESPPSSDSETQHSHGSRRSKKSHNSTGRRQDQAERRKHRHSEREDREDREDRVDVRSNATHRRERRRDNEGEAYYRRRGFAADDDTVNVPRRDENRGDVRRVDERRGISHPRGAEGPARADEDRLTFLRDSDDSLDAGACQRATIRPSIPRQGKPLQSGMVAKPTDTVIFPQNWPHITLKCDRVGGSYTFQELDWRQFVTGELELLSSYRISPDEHEGRIRLLKQLMQLSQAYEWQVIMKLYTEVVSQIEQGLIVWGSSFEATLHWALAQHNNNHGDSGNSKQNARTSGGRQPSKKSSSKSRPTYCKEYQTNACPSTDDKHWGMVNGERMMVEHICAACLMRKKEVAHHNEMSGDCPSKGAGRNYRQ